MRRNDSIKTSGVTIHKSPQVSINDFSITSPPGEDSSLFSFLVVKFKSLSPFFLPLCLVWWEAVLYPPKSYLWLAPFCHFHQQTAVEPALEGNFNGDGCSGWGRPTRLKAGYQTYPNHGGWSKIGRSFPFVITHYLFEGPLYTQCLITAVLTGVDNNQAIYEGKWHLKLSILRRPK